MNLNALLPLQSQLQAEAKKFSTEDRTYSSSREEISSSFLKESAKHKKGAQKRKEKR